MSLSKKYCIILLLFLTFPNITYAEPMAYSTEIATLTIAMEASGEGPNGELAVAFVLLNRIKAGKWGSNLASVSLARKQFSCWNEDDPNRLRAARLDNSDPVIISAQKALNLALSGAIPDPTKGATHYYAASIQPPFWASSGNFLIQIGNHRFYNNVP